MKEIGTGIPTSCLVRTGDDGNTPVNLPPSSDFSSITVRRSPPNGESRPSIVIQQDCVPQYRLRLFEILSIDPHSRCRIIADASADTPFLALITPEQTEIAWELARVRHYSIGPSIRFTWQPAAVTHVLRERPDLVIAQGSPYSLTGWALALIGRVLGIPVLLWTHGLLDNETGVKWSIRKALYKLGAGLLLYGDHAKAVLMEKGFARDRLHVIYNSVGLSGPALSPVTPLPEDCRCFREKLGIKAGERLVVFSGRLQPEKQIPLLLHAVAAMQKHGKIVHVGLVGDGSEKDALRRLAGELGIGDLVHFFGPIYEESHIGLVFSSSDLSVIPAAAGLSIIHAMAYGTPVLLHERVEDHGPEWEAVTEGLTGFFFKYADAGDLAEKASAALFPVPLKPNMAQACRDVIEQKYNPNRQAQAIRDAVRATLMPEGCAR
jgi:L-malate glycosyltransferase